MNQATVYPINIDGQLVGYLANEAGTNQWYEVKEVEEREGLNGLFNKGGFFDKIITSGSKVFKKEDGSTTFIGESIKDVASQFGNQLANNVSGNRFNNSFMNPGFNFQNGLVPTSGSNLPPTYSNPNPLPPSKNNTAVIVGGSLVAATLIAGGIILAKRNKKK